MKQQVLYRYLGTNGVIESPVHLEDVYYIRTICLTADEGKILTDGIQYVKTVRVSEEEVSKWKEVKDLGQE